MFLAPLYEVWNWSDDDAIFVGIVLAVFGIFGAGYLAGRGDEQPTPRWAMVALVCLFLGIGLVIAATGGADCATAGDCERPGP